MTRTAVSNPGLSRLPGAGDTITAYVPGAIAGNYHFTSAIAVQLLKAIEPQLEPVLRSPATDAPLQAISQIEPIATGFRKPANTETEGVAGSSD